MRFRVFQNDISPQRTMIFGFAAVILIGTVLLALPVSSADSRSIGWLDALFTATSAVCVTGLAVLDTGSDFSFFGQLVIMLLVQIGGLGFMTYGVIFAVLLGKKISLKDRLLVRESTKSISFKGVVRLTFAVIVIAFSLELIAAAVLTLRWAGEFGWQEAAYLALFHAVSAFNSAGFSLWPDSLSRYVGDPIVNLTISALVIIGGLGFTVLVDIYEKRNWRQLTLHSKVVILTSSILTLGGFLVFFILESFNPHTFGHLTLGERLWAAFFQSVTPRSAGFNTIDTGAMMSTSLLFTIFLMFVGASTGSTGGGIKTNTFAVLILTLKSVVKGQEEVTVLNRRISGNLVFQALAVIVLSFGIVLLACLLLTITERTAHHDFLEILFEATSAFGTTGLSMGVTRELTPLGKFIVIATMFIGRLGPLTFAFALALKPTKSKIRYPEDKILIG
ncbi:TrkH family potassium uptake protein [Caldibacillus debilis]|uniref:TrkH family potassium uptake protein n=1 Tax=Caldibacillus debilis TaxID=301148 RepID=UPI000B549EBB|nr:TrkH family potassium uptake protein [Caldibacillus debilis]OUM88018.1 MAG: Ktr system potassium transporter B [Caldibacillus debilis]REJ24391.1 MAG: Ktr system potassium transporter B [Caldibacillus debilis]